MSHCISSLLMSWQICVAVKFHEGSVGDRMAQLKGGKLQLSGVLRCCFWGFNLFIYFVMK